MQPPSLPVWIASAAPDMFRAASWSPLLVKDTLRLADQMQTTAGSLAIYGNQVPADAVIIQRLRTAGAVILGKRIWRWANFRTLFLSFRSAVGWSARGGNTINAYDVSYTSGDRVLVRKPRYRLTRNPSVCARRSARRQTGQSQEPSALRTLSA